MCQRQGDDVSGGFDMQLIGNFLSFASRGDRVGLNQMLRNGISPDVQDYDSRTALHLAASEGHAPIVELLLHYKAKVNLIDRWKRTPLTDARLYGHRDICRILEVNGGKDMDDQEFINDQPMMNDQAPMTVRHEQAPNEVIDISELITENVSIIKQGVFGEAHKVKWRGTWVVKTVIKRQIYHPHHPVTMILTSKENTLLQELRHPNILQFLGSIVQGEEMILIIEYLPMGNLDDILRTKGRLDFPTALRYALDIARGMNYLHKHKPYPIVHNNLDPRQVLPQFSEGNCGKMGQINETSSMPSNLSNGINKDVRAFGFIFYQMLEGTHLLNNMNFDFIHLDSVDFEMKFPISRCPKRIQQLIKDCTSTDPSERPEFFNVIDILEDVSTHMGNVCIGHYCA
ncbi:Serine-threonine/tyrosine-protein kinase [Theobroma cacao]|nr:Serine-threonine/tyrosine-protein kinase [Theobroma cacao]WRX35197.1 Serine-threonine/tyrosine-protein kinase [Theobroma cacao]